MIFTCIRVEYWLLLFFSGPLSGCGFFFFFFYFSFGIERGGSGGSRLVHLLYIYVCGFQYYEKYNLFMHVFARKVVLVSVFSSGAHIPDTIRA